MFFRPNFAGREAYCLEARSLDALLELLALALELIQLGLQGLQVHGRCCLQGCCREVVSSNATVS